MAGIHQDVTEQKQAERIIRESELKQRSLLEAMRKATDAMAKRENLLTTITENINETIIMLDRDHRLAYVNRAGIQTIRTLLGKPDLVLNDLVGKWAKDLFPDSDIADKLICADELAMQAGTSTTEEHLFTTPGGPQILRINRLPLRNNDGQVNGLVNVTYDITELKQQEKQRLDSLKRQRDNLVREVHHRIKNHLQGVLGLLYNTTSAEPDLAERMEPVIRQIKSIASVYGMSSVTGGTSITVCELISRIICSYQNQYKIELTADSAPRSLTLHTEEAVLTSLIINELLNNAIKHRKTNSPTKPVKILITNDKGVACVKIISGPACLPPDFNVDDWSYLGTGIELVKALMHSKNSRLEVEQCGDEVIVSYYFSVPEPSPQNGSGI